MFLSLSQLLWAGGPGERSLVLPGVLRALAAEEAHLHRVPTRI